MKIYRNSSIMGVALIYMALISIAATTAKVFDTVEGFKADNGCGYTIWSNQGFLENIPGVTLAACAARCHANSKCAHFRYGINDFICRIYDRDSEVHSEKLPGVICNDV